MLNENETRRISEIAERIKESISHALSYLPNSRQDFEPSTYFALAYSAYVASLTGINKVDDLLSHIESKISERRAQFVKSAAGDKLEIVFHLAREFSADDLLNYIYLCPKRHEGRRAGLYDTPESISKLALRILDVKAGESIADFGSGLGDFLLLTAEQYKDNPLYGIEYNLAVSDISTVRTELFSDKAVIEQGDMFALSEGKKFDKIFTNFPFGTGREPTWKRSEYLNALQKRLPEIRVREISDWIFNFLLLDHLTDKGKAVAVMTSGSTFNSFDREIRKYFINNGFIEAVIDLPAGLFESGYFHTAIIVISRGNKSIKLIDASRLYEQGRISRRINRLSDSNIDYIVELLAKGGTEAVSVDLKKFQDNDFLLYSHRYLNEIELVDGVEFGSLMKRLTRGTQLMGERLAKLSSDVPTDTQYLNVTNIQNGVISEDLPYLKDLDSKLDKYCIGNRNLLLSKNGTLSKVAIAEVEEGKKILGSGNLLIVELDENKVNPYFLKAFFDSEMGRTALRSITTGASIPNIPIDSLKELRVPLPSIEKQNKIANLYQAKLYEIRILQSKLQKAQNDLQKIFEEVE